MMKKLLLTSVAAMAGAAGSAAAADLPARLPVKALPPAVQLFSWTGCYAGAQAGKAWGDTRNVTAGVTADTDGWLAGGQIGCDHQFAPNWVVGVEGMAAWMDMDGRSDPFFSGKNVFRFSTQTNWIASATARIGFSVDRWLIYAKGGAAWSDHDYRVLGSSTDRRGSDTVSGWTWGVGLEWAFAPNWSTKLEYNQYDFDRNSVRLNDRFGGSSTRRKFEHEIRTVTLGINYRFATGPR